MELQNNASLEMVHNILDGTTPPAKAGAADEADKLGNLSAGSQQVPAYFEDGVPKQCSGTLSVNISGSAASAANATNATNDGNGNNIAATYVKRSGMSTSSFSVDGQGNVTLLGASETILGGIRVYTDSSGYLCIDTSPASA